VDVHRTAFLSVSKEMQCVLPNIFSPVVSIAISWTLTIVKQTVATTQKKKTKDGKIRQSILTNHTNYMS